MNFNPIADADAAAVAAPELHGEQRNHVKVDTSRSQANHDKRQYSHRSKQTTQRHLLTSRRKFEDDDLSNVAATAEVAVNSMAGCSNGIELPPLDPVQSAQVRVAREYACIISKIQNLHATLQNITLESTYNMWKLVENWTSTVDATGLHYLCSSTVFTDAFYRALARANEMVADFTEASWDETHYEGSIVYLLCCIYINITSENHTSTVTTAISPHCVPHLRGLLAKLPKNVVIHGFLAEALANLCGHGDELCQMIADDALVGQIIQCTVEDDSATMDGFGDSLRLSSARLLSRISELPLSTLRITPSTLKMWLRATMRTAHPHIWDYTCAVLTNWTAHDPCLCAEVIFDSFAFVTSMKATIHQLTAQQCNTMLTIVRDAFLSTAPELLGSKHAMTFEICKDIYDIFVDFILLQTAVVWHQEQQQQQQQPSMEIMDHSMLMSLNMDTMHHWHELMRNATFFMLDVISMPIGFAETISALVVVLIQSAYRIVTHIMCTFHDVIQPRSNNVTCADDSSRIEMIQYIATQLTAPDFHCVHYLNRVLFCIWSAIDLFMQRIPLNARITNHSIPLNLSAALDHLLLHKYELRLLHQCVALREKSDGIRVVSAIDTYNLYYTTVIQQQHLVGSAEDGSEALRFQRFSFPTWEMLFKSS